MKAVLMATLLALPLAAGAQSVYKCGNTFSQTPCGSDARQISTAPAPVVPPSAELVATSTATCEARVRAALLDPDAAKISNIRRAGPVDRTVDGVRIAGVAYLVDVNAKNAFGGYTGVKTHMCIFSADESRFLFST